MKEETTVVLEEFLSHKEELVNDVLGDFEEMLGVLPFIFKYQSERPESCALSVLGDMYIARPESLDPKTAELITIAAASAHGADGCLKVHIGAAMKEGATRDEILDTIMIAGMVGKTKVLAQSFRTFRDVIDKTEK